MPDFKDRVVVVSGAAGNLGGVVSNAFRQFMGPNWLFSIDDLAGFRKSTATWQMIHPTCSLETVDMTDPDSVEDSYSASYRQAWPRGYSHQHYRRISRRHSRFTKLP